MNTLNNDSNLFTHSNEVHTILVVENLIILDASDIKVSDVQSNKIFVQNNVAADFLILVDKEIKSPLKSPISKVLTNVVRVDNSPHKLV